MSNEDQLFGKQQADRYDKQWEKLASLNQALYLLSEIVLNELPAEAGILCVGAGTGNELMALAKKKPDWQFMAVDTSEAMLDVCKEKVARAGFLSRCEFHLGPIDTLPQQVLYDAATSILVSQFYMDKPQRKNFFRAIFGHLKPGAYLISADLAAPPDKTTSKSLMDAWFKMHMYAGLSEELAKNSTSQWGKLAAVLKPSEVEEIISSAGFRNITQFYQTLFIHSWFAKVPIAKI